MSATYDETTKTTLIVNKIPLELFEDITATADELWFVPDDDEGDIVLGTIGDWVTNVRNDNPYGCILADGGTYADQLSVDFTKNNFPDLYAKLVDGTIPSVTMSTFEDYYYRYGWCGVFGLDTTNERFRVPKVTYEAQENVTPLSNTDNSNLGRTLVESQNPTSSNSYTWYNLYSDGWVESGGETTIATAGTYVTITLPKSLKNTDYYVAAKSYDSSGTEISNTFTFNSFNTTSFNVTASTAVTDTNYVRWFCSGYRTITNDSSKKYYIRAFNTHREASLVDLKSDMDSYVDNTLKPNLLTYTNDTLKPSLLTYTNDTLKPALLSYTNSTLKPALDTYVTGTNEPALDSYVNNTNKPALDTYVNSTLKPLLDQYIAQKVLELTGIAVGTIVPYAGTTVPDGWFLCDGRSLYQTDYGALYSVIGTTYGKGAESSGTFNVPNLDCPNIIPDCAYTGTNISYPFTAPENGWLFWAGDNVGSRTVSINGINFATHSGSTNHWADYNTVVVHLKYGDVVSGSYSRTQWFPEGIFGKIAIIKY